MSLLHRLQALDPAATLARPAPRTLAWLTGQSNPASARLSAAQARLLAAVVAPGWQAVPSNFPYNQGALGLASPEPWLPLASWRNAAQFVALLLRPATGPACARHLQPLLDATTTQLVLLCGSCGLQLFYAALPWLHVPPGLRLHLVALGPAALRRPAHPQVAVTVVRGRGDWLSRCLCALPTDHALPGGHLDYALRPETARVLRQVLGNYAAPPALAAGQQP